MPLLFGVFVAAALVVAWFTVTMKAPAARANLFADMPVEAKPQTSGVRALGERLRRFVPTSLVKNMETDLAQAGHPHGIDVPRLLGIQAVLIVILSMLCLLVGYPILLLGAVAAGFIAPRYWISKLRITRQEAVSAAVSDTLDQLTICVESGLGFDAALLRVASTNDGPLSAELEHTVSDMRAGVPRDQALRALAARTRLPEIKTVTQALIQAQRHGTPLADTLRIQAAEVREKRKQNLEEQSAKLGTKLIFPTVLLFFPVFFVVLLGPAISALAGAFGSLQH
jgi:tight adherence protein C